jgi:hypothetical protein
LFFVLFIDVAWIYAAYNIAVIIFGAMYRWAPHEADATSLPLGRAPAVALLYTTCNDFAEAPVLSCLAQDYPCYRLYILDDSYDAGWRARIDAFATAHPDKVKVARVRGAAKAGNLNRTRT